MQNVEIKNLDNSEIEIIAEIPTEEFETYRKKAVEKLSKEVEIHGFRKGHIPESVLVQKIGESAILYEMAESTIAKEYIKIISEHKIAALGRPEITITKIAKGNPLGFKAKTAVMPEVKLPDYKAIAGSVTKKPDELILVTDEERDKVIDELRKNLAKSDKDNEQKLPELTDDFVKKLGTFENVEDFKQKIKNNLIEEKKLKAKEKKRIELIEEIVKESEILVPHVLIDAEKEKMLAQFKENISQMGMKLEDYFKEIKKTEEEMKKEWSDNAKKRVKIELILHKIAEYENIKIPNDEIEKAVKRITNQYKNANPERARAYVENLLMNEKVFELLEKQ